MPLVLQNPSGLWLLAALGPLAALYLLRVRRKRQIVPSTWLWSEVHRDLIAERPFLRFIPEVPLLLEALAIVLLALALSRPSLKGAVLPADHVAIVIDASASMGATDGKGTRFDEARRAVQNVLSRLAPGAETLVVEAGAEPHVATRFERDRQKIVADLSRLAPRDEPADLPRAVAFAADLLSRTGGARRIVLVTDVNAEVPKASTLPLDVVRVGSVANNVAITRIEVRRSVDPVTHRESASVFVLVKNFGVEREDRVVSVFARDRDRDRAQRGNGPLASRRAVLSPGERAGVVLSFEVAPSDTGKGIVAELSPGDALAVDDRAFASIPPGPRLPVVVAPPGGDPWLGRALAADSEVELFETTMEVVDSGGVPSDALVVTFGACPRSPPAGDLLVLNPGPGDCLGLDVGGIVENPVVTSWSDHDPRFRFLTLSDLAIKRARALRAPRGSELLQAGNSTFIADLGLPGRSGTVVSFDLDRSNWPLNASFVLFVRNVTELARKDRTARLGVPARTGEILRLPVPSSRSIAVRVRGPLGESPARLIEGAVVAPPPARAGFYDALDPSGAVLASAAVNLSNEGESDLRRRPSASAKGPAVASKNVAAESHPDLGWPFALVAMGCVLAEMYWLGRRGVRRTAGLQPACQSAKWTLFALLALSTSVAGYAWQLRAGAASEHLLRFGRSEWTLVGALAVLLVALFSSRGVTVHLGRARRTLFEATLALAAWSSALAAAEPSFGVALDRLAVIVAVDRSRSIDLCPGAAVRIDRGLTAAGSSMRPGDRVGVVAFAGDAALEEPLRLRTEPRSPETAALARDRTNLAAGLLRALAEAPSDAAARIVLATDGLSTEGDTMSAAFAAALSGVPVDVLPLEQARVANVRAEALHLPAHADAGETMDLRITTRSTTDADVDVTVSSDGVSKSAGRRHLHVGEDVFWVRERAERPGLFRYEVHLTPVDPSADAVAADNDAAAFVRVLGPSRALIIEDEASRAAPIHDALTAAAFQVDVVGATRAPLTLDDLAKNDLIVLGDVPAQDLSTAQIAELAAYVRELGGGLLFFGGDRAMGPGGYGRTPLEEVSPVSFELPNERRVARLAEVIAIDTSGSMSAQAGQHTKLELANEAAARSASLLKKTDRVGVEHVDTSVTWTVPMRALTDPVDVGRRIRAAGPGGGGIFVDVALTAAYAALDAEHVELKHLLLFADSDDAEQRERAPDLARAAHARGITTSVVALGRGRDAAALDQLSRAGKGRFYLIEDASRLPAVFARETTIAAGSAVHEVAFRPAPGTGDPATRGVDLATAPELRGYVVTTAKARAEVSLLAPDRDPLLSTWSVGAGRVGAFTSDYGGKWGGSWASWPGAARLFAQLGRELARRSDNPNVALDAEASGGTLTVRATELSGDGGGDSFRRFTANVAGPDGFSASVPLVITGPGSYAARLPVGHPGGYVAEVRDEAANAPVGTTGTVLSQGDELDPVGTDHALLARIASVTGGRVLQTLGDAFAKRPPARRSFRSLVPLFTVASVAWLLLAVGARRLSLPSLVPAALKRAPAAAVAEPVLAEPLDAPSAAPSTTTEELLKRRRRRQRGGDR